MSVSRATIEDLRAFLTFLVRTRRDELLAVPDIAFRARRLDEVLAAIEALGVEGAGDRPNSLQLAEADATHDALYRAIRGVALAHLELPSASEETRASARKVIEVAVPRVDEVMASYADEAMRAAERAPHIEAARAHFERFPTADGGTLFDWTMRMLQAARTLGELLQGRADAESGRSHVPRLRTEAIGLVQRTRDHVAEVLAHDPAAARRADERLFGYLDTLTAMRRSGSKEPPPAPPTT